MSCPDCEARIIAMASAQQNLRRLLEWASYDPTPTVMRFIREKGVLAMDSLEEGLGIDNRLEYQKLAGREWSEFPK